VLLSDPIVAVRREAILAVRSANRPPMRGLVGGATLSPSGSRQGTGVDG